MGSFNSLVSKSQVGLVILVLVFLPERPGTVLDRGQDLEGNLRV